MAFVKSEEKTNFVKIVMENGKEMVAELYPEIAPITVKNFQKLVQVVELVHLFVQLVNVTIFEISIQEKALSVLDVGIVVCILTLQKWLLKIHANLNLKDLDKDLCTNSFTILQKMKESTDVQVVDAV